MTQYKTLNVKLSKSQLNKLVKNDSELTLNLSSNGIGNSNDETNFPHKLLLSNTQVSRLPKTFANNSSTNIKGPLHERISMKNFYPHLSFFEYSYNFYT